MSSIERERYFKRLLRLEIKHYSDSNHIEPEDIGYGIYKRIANKYNMYVHKSQFSNVEITIICSNLWSKIKKTNYIMIEPIEYMD